MITRSVRVRVAVFLVLGLLAMGYTGVRYVGLLRLVGVGVYTVHLELPSAGGVFPNAEVDYRGVPVGRVTSVRLTATGVEAELQLRRSAPKIPADVHAVVADLSVIGEQYVDLKPRDNRAPYLVDGSHIGRRNATIPPTSNALLSSTDALLRSLPTASLRTVVRQLDAAFGGSADTVGRLIESSRAFIVAANTHLPQTEALISTSATALRTQRAASASITSFSADLKLLARHLAGSNSVLTTVLRDVPPAARSVTSLIRSLGAPLGATIGNLTSAAQVLRANVRGVQELLVSLPRAVDIGNTVFRGGRAHVGLTLNFFNPLPCTQGYGGTQRRSGLDVGAGRGLNTAAGCTAPSGTDARGAQHAASNAATVPSWLDEYAAARVRSVHTLAALLGGR